MKAITLLPLGLVLFISAILLRRALDPGNPAIVRIRLLGVPAVICWRRLSAAKRRCTLRALIGGLYLGKCAPQLGGALSHRFFQSSALIFEHDVKSPDLEKIADTQKRFCLANWLYQKVSRSSFQCAGSGLFSYVSGQHHDWQKTFRAILPKRFQQSKPVHLWHDQVEQD